MANYGPRVSQVSPRASVVSHQRDPELGGVGIRLKVIVRFGVPAGGHRVSCDMINMTLRERKPCSDLHTAPCSRVVWGIRVIVYGTASRRGFFYQ